VREGVASLLTKRDDIEVVGEAAAGEETVGQYRRLKPDVAVVDLAMPKMDGVAAITAIRAEFPSARFVVLTTYDGDEDIHRALRAGAQAYLLKDTGRQELVDTIRAVHAGEKRLPRSVAAKLAERVLTVDLTDRERDVLGLIVKGLSNREIGEALNVTEGTVKGYVNTLLAKLGVRDRTQAVTVALKRGLVRL